MTNNSLYRRRYLAEIIPQRRFDKNTIHGFMVNDSAYTLDDVTNEFGIDIIDAFNSAPDVISDRVKTSIFFLKDNLTTIKVTNYYSRNAYNYDYSAAFRLYSNGNFIKNIKCGETYTYESSENTKNYIISYLREDTLQEDDLGCPVGNNICVFAFAGYIFRYSANSSITKLWFFHGDRENWLHFPTATYGTELLGGIYVPNGIVNLGGRCLLSQNKFDSIRLPNTWKHKDLQKQNDSLVFYGDTGISKVIYQGTLQQWKEKDFSYEDCKDGSYMGACTPFYVSPDAEFFTKDGIEKPTTIEYYEEENIVDYCSFLNMRQFTTLILPNNITEFRAGAFTGCINLECDITNKFQNTTLIGNQAFRSCKKLTGQVICPKLQTIGDFAFFQCTGLSGQLSFPSTTQTIGANAFRESYSITNISFSDGLQYIGGGSFYRAWKNGSIQEELIIPESVTFIGGDHPFLGCEIKRTIFNCHCDTGYGYYYYSSNILYVDFNDIQNLIITQHGIWYSWPIQRAVVLRGDTIPQNLSLLSLSNGTVYCKEENVASFQQEWSTPGEYIGFTIYETLPQNPEEGKYYYQNLDNHIYKYENSAWTDITATYV